MRCEICDCSDCVDQNEKCTGEVTWNKVHQQFMCDKCREEIYGSLAELEFKDADDERDNALEDVEGFTLLEVGEVGVSPRIPTRERVLPEEE